MTPFLQACVTLQDDVVELLAASGADINALLPYSIESVARGGGPVPDDDDDDDSSREGGGGGGHRQPSGDDWHSGLFEVLLFGRVDIARVLLDYGASLQPGPDGGGTVSVGVFFFVSCVTCCCLCCNLLL